MKNNKIKIFKVLIFILFIIILGYIVLKFVPIFKNIATENGRIEFQKQINELGIKGIFIILSLIFIQIFLPILPGEPIELLSGMCYGSIGGMLVIFLGVFISTFIIFYLVRKFGKDFIYNFVKKEKLEKIEKSELFNNHKKLEILLFLAFFIPGIPKDIFVFIGGLLPVETKKFLIIATFARFPSIISSTMAGANVIYGNWKTIVFIYIITFSISGIMMFFYNKKNLQE